MDSNFSFLRDQFPTIYDHASQAEGLVFSNPRASCFYTRFVLEQMVCWLYKNDPYLQPPRDNSLGALIHEQTFKDNLKPGLFGKIRTIHKVGNNAAHHTSPISERDSLHLIEELFHLTYWLVRYYGQNGRKLGDISFDRQKIPPAAPPAPKQLQDLEKRLSQSDALRQLAEAKQRQTEAELAAARAERDALLAQNRAIADRHDYNEADTRRYLIDVLLQEAGWDTKAPNATEFEVWGMPIQQAGDTGRGFVDYVLWGDDGKPLALVEAKRTSKSPDSGQDQAKLYADSLEKNYNQRPVIFYSNGYETYLWDDLTYPPRPVLGFLRKTELERLIFRRSHRKRLRDTAINEDIVGRPYQKEAIRRITQTFEEKCARKSLLVMATGTGKTRTAIALVELLKSANWVNRVLFLADRNALLKQAYRAFQRHLPSVTVLHLTRSKDVTGANVIFSTYQTMLNAIDRMDAEGRIFGVGYFDLVIVDEAHRSIYQKYGEIFDYFDALLVGLTATPRSEIDRDTYRIFQLPQGVPTFAYELNDAVRDGHLVPPKGVTVPFKFLRTGVKYSELTPQERLDYEEKFRDEESGELPQAINAAAFNDWLFNIDTVDQALELLMQRGLKVNSGDRLGKTIIFARNHRHAQCICDRFNSNYPHYKGHFAKIIDSHDNYAQSLLDQFSEANKEPILAVSVDMLDTGVDVPEVVNLVFFKPVFSRVKFNQMIGRGTRLCQDLFGPGNHKTEFLVFDLCGNFEYFEQDIDETSQKIPESLTSRLVKHRLELATRLAPSKPSATPRAREQSSTYKVERADDLYTSLLDALHQHIATMPRDNFLVRRRLPQVETFSQRQRWNNLSQEDAATIADSLAGLPNSLPNEDPLAKEFDLLCVKLQLAILKADRSYERLRDKVRDILGQLETKPDIPMIKGQLAFIRELQDESWWTGATPSGVERIRVRIRDLVKFIDRQKQQIVITDFVDEMGEVQIVDIPTHQTGFSREQYRRKVEAYIRQHQDHLAIAKLRRNIPLTETDLSALEEMLFSAAEIESRQRFEEVFGQTKSLKLLILEIVGLDPAGIRVAARQAAKQAFGRYLQGTNFSANQIRFIENIIDMLAKNGVINPGALYEPPFTDNHPEGLDGMFNDQEADRIVSILRSFNESVDAV
ncbi:DEAD/DEAH box helicase family protein [Microcystis sp.]|uniref:DEAD/DEAH box helicase family protein n=1 Tax=Microcystis sp. TaxID=1127 RepID=UPI00391B0651